MIVWQKMRKALLKRASQGLAALVKPERWQKKKKRRSGLKTTFSQDEITRNPEGLIVSWTSFKCPAHQVLLNL